MSDDEIKWWETALQYTSDGDHFKGNMMIDKSGMQTLLNAVKDYRRQVFDLQRDLAEMTEMWQASEHSIDMMERRQDG